MARVRPTPADWRALAAGLDGGLVRRHDVEFGMAKRLFNPRFDEARPLAVVEAASAADVSEAITFARRFGMPLRAKSGGHSYVGASTVTDGLVIDVRRLHATHYDPGSASASVGAGARLYPAHAALAVHGRSIPTGTCPTVGAAGLTLGGGIGVDSRRHGLTCDALTGLTLVTADGAIRHARPDRNPDLFWASRGGGGGNFGIVTSLRFATHAAEPMGFFLVTFPWSRAARVLRGWARRANAMPRSAWANARLEAATDGSTRVRVVGTCQAGDEAAQAAAMEAAVGVDATSVSTFEKSFLDGIEFLGGGTTSPRENFAAGSDVVAAMPLSLAHTLVHVVARRAAARRSAAVILDPLTGAVQDVAGGASAFPWRRHLADIQWYVGLPSDASRGAVRATYDWIEDAQQAIAPWSVGGYVNYVDPRRSVGSYYGPNLARLRQIKQRFDPTGVFDFRFGIR